MILEFSISNFLSFKEKVTFSMQANSNSGLEDNYFVVDDRKILKTSAIYGGNASGKTNLFKILFFVKYMLANSNKMDINTKLSILPFKFSNDNKNKPSEFEIKFIIDKIRYVYGFSADENKIYEEYLYYYPKHKETKIFDRVNTSDYSFPQKDEKYLKDIALKTSDNKFFLATATNWNYEKTKMPYKFLTTGINVFNNISDLRNIAFDIYSKDENDLKSFTLDFLKKADFNITDYSIVETNVPENVLASIPDFLKEKININPKILNAVFKHLDSDEMLSLDDESLGTQMIFLFIPFIYDALNNQRVLIVDELDKSLHPYLVELIVNMFNDSEINKYGAQLIFNTHDTNLLDLDLLRRDQIWFTEKNSDDGSSDLYCLADFSVRKTENIEKGYLLGKYGAVPFIKNDFNLWYED